MEIDYQDVLASFLETESLFNEASIKFSEEVNSMNISVVEIKIESKSRLGLVLIYEDMYFYFDVHDKVTIEPVFNVSESFKNVEELLDNLRNYFYKYWE